MAQHRYSDNLEHTPNTRPSQEEEHLLDTEPNAHGHHPGDIHLATLGEKKRLWWRNAVINAIFILSWCVSTHGICIFKYLAELTAQVFLCYDSVCVQQMDVLKNSLWLPCPSFCDHDAHACAVYPRCVPPFHMASSFPSGTSTHAWRI